MWKKIALPVLALVLLVGVVVVLPLSQQGGWFVGNMFDKKVASKSADRTDQQSASCEIPSGANGTIEMSQLSSYTIENNANDAIIYKFLVTKKGNPNVKFLVQPSTGLSVSDLRVFYPDNQSFTMCPNSNYYILPDGNYIENSVYTVTANITNSSQIAEDIKVSIVDKNGTPIGGTDVTLSVGI